MTHPITCAKSELLAHELVHDYAERFFLKSQGLPDTRGNIQQRRAKCIQSSHCAFSVRGQQLAHDACISARGEFLIHGETEAFELRTRTEPGNGFREHA